MSDYLLQLQAVRAGYGAISALRDISLTVSEDEIVTVIGSNGAGKTTTLMSIAGAHRIWSGQIVFANQFIHNLPACEIVRLGIALVPEGRKIFPRLTVLENLELGAYTQPSRTQIKRDLRRIFELFPILEERQYQSGGTLSGGEQQMLALGRALMSRPRLLLMDEPSMGIAPLVVQTIFHTIRELNAQGMTILFVEQNANLALKTAHRGYVIENGETAIDGPADMLLIHPRVCEAYLG